MHLVLAAADSKSALVRELSGIAGDKHEVCPGMFALTDDSAEGFRPFAFARQILPDAVAVAAPSIGAWANVVLDAIVGVLPDDEPWSFHAFPLQEVEDATRLGARAFHSLGRGASPKRLAREQPAGAERPARPERSSGGAGPTRCRLIYDAVIERLENRRRSLARSLRREPSMFLPAEALVQLVLTTPESGFLSVLPAPSPFTHRASISFFPGGETSAPVDKNAPSRAFAKLLEAETRMAQRIGPRQTCVDLGAAPGSWTYVAARRGARVTAVDRAELRADLMQSKLVRFHRGDAFRFTPEEAVDWLICDVIANAERSAEILERWLRNRWCRSFVVTLKVDDGGSVHVIDHLRRELAALASESWLLRLCANKKEVCAFGLAAHDSE